MIKVSRNQRRQNGNVLAEFAPTVFIVFVMSFFPLMNLIGVCTGAVTVMLVTNEAASNAAAQETYATSLDAMYAGAFRFLAGNCAKFAHIQPAGGYHACGINLYTQVTSTGGGSNLVGPNTPLNPPIDLTDNVYEYAAVSDYLVGPFVSMETLPFFGKIPGVGAPFRMVFRATRMVEHPLGLANAANQEPANNGSAPSLFDRSLTSPSSSNNASAPGASYNYGQWRDPNIFDQIAAAGQTVVSINVVVINAAQPWQQSGVSIASGQTAWIDTNAVGTWELAPNTTALDANGWTNDPNDIANMMKGAGAGGLIGYCGSTPPAVVPNNYGYSQPGLFLVGDTLTNYKLPNPGSLNFMINDNCLSDNSGTQVVRVIVTQSQ